MANSYRQILRSSSIVGGASVVNILVGLLRMKVAAVLLGPAGVGLIGMFQNLMTTASTVAALGLGTVGTRQIAEAVGREDAPAVDAARRALFWATLILSVLGGAVFWALRAMLADRVLHDRTQGEALGWLAIGVALAVGSGSQGALLNGLRHIGDLARISVLSGVVSTLIGVVAVMVWGREGIAAFVVSAPLSSFALGHWYVAKLGPVTTPRTPTAILLEQWRVMARLGLAFMVSGLVVTLGQLAVRSLVEDGLGIDALGQFQASWTISMTYIGFVLTAMGTDYYPRLTAAIEDHEVANRLVNEQSEVAFLLAGPVFLVMFGLAPWIMELLYSSRFDVASDLLRWQIFGDVLKVASWPLGFIILAMGAGKTFLTTETVVTAVFVALTWVGLPSIGLPVTGFAFIGMYVVNLALVYGLARLRTGFRWSSRPLSALAVLLVLLCTVRAVCWWSEIGGAAVALVASAGFGAHALARLGHMAELTGPVGRLAGISRGLLTRAGLWRD